jgi:iron complex outermembrane receptor protein
VRWFLNDHWQATLSSAVQQLRSSDTQYVILTPDNILLHRSNQVRETHNNDFAQVALTVSGEGAWGRLLSSTSLVRHAYASRYNASSVLEAFGADPNDDLGIFDEATSIRRLVEDAYWSSPETGRWHLTAGLFGSTSLNNTPSSLSSRPNEPTVQPLRLLYSEARRDSMNEGAVYGVASYDLGGGWVAAAGARAFLTEVHTLSDVMSTPGQSRSANERKSFAGVSPKISLQKQWANSNYIYALTSTGYRAGGFNTGGRLTPTRNATFRPDRLQNFEIGGEANGLDGRLKLRTALFYDHWSDIQTDQYLVSGLSYTANVGDGRNIGWESELSYQATPGLKFELNGLLDRPQVTSLNPLFTAVRGARLPGVPNTAVAGLVTYQKPLAQGRRLVLTAQATFTGSSRLTFDARFSPLTPSYYSANLSAQLQTPRYWIALFVSNPFNSLSDTFSYGNPFSFGQVRQVTPQRPRTISVLLSRSF